MKFFKENLILKLVSVVLALLLWLIVFNVSNPEQKESRTVIGVRLPLVIPCEAIWLPL